jgi:hypothetical protein
MFADGVYLVAGQRATCALHHTFRARPRLTRARDGLVAWDSDQRRMALQHNVIRGDFCRSGLLVEQTGSTLSGVVAGRMSVEAYDEDAGRVSLCRTK